MQNALNLEIACKQILGMTSRRYRVLVAEQGAPEIIKGEIDVLKAAKWIIDYYRALAQGQGSLSLTDERTRLTKINADRKELQLKREQGELLHVHISQGLWGNTLMQMRQKILAMPIKLSPLIIGSKTIAEIKDMTEKFMHEVLNDLSETEPRLDESKGSVNGNTTNAKAAPKVKYKRMGRRKKKTKS